MTGSKDIVRHEARLHRERIDPASEDVGQATALFMDAVMAGRPVPSRVALYWPHGREFDTRDLMHALLQAGHVCALPVIERGSRILKFLRWRDGDPLEAGPFSILQPVASSGCEWVDPDVVVVPLLAFDRKGGRIGYGGGYYDSTLRALRAGGTNVLAVGIGYAQQAVLFALPAEDHDERLDWVVTPAQAHDFRGMD